MEIKEQNSMETEFGFHNEKWININKKNERNVLKTKLII